jgi:ABC-2 type transport system permease protein
MASTLRAALLIAGNDLRRRFRNRSFIVQAFIGPVVLALVISAAFSGGFGFDVTIGDVDLDRSEAARAIEVGLIGGRAEEVEFAAVPDVASGRGAIEEDDLDALLVLPAGFGQSLSGPTPLPMEVLTDQGNVVAGAVGKAVAQGVAASVDAGRLTVAALAAEGLDPPSTEDLAGIDLPIAVEQEGAGDELSPASLVAPGMGLLFLFFTVAAVARALLDERRKRVLDRMLAAPVTLTAVLLGKAIAVVVLGGVSLGTLWGATALLLDADWGDPLGVAAVLFAATLAVAGISAVVAAMARDEQSADLVATAVAFILGILGGSLVPLSELPDGLVRVSLFTPNGWAQRAFAELSAGGGDLEDVLPEVGVLLGWAAVTVLLAAVLPPRRLAAR